MAQTTAITPSMSPRVDATPSSGRRAASSAGQLKQRGQSLHQTYALPAPIRTFPLPSFYPENPISLVHLVYTWVKQVLLPPPNEPSAVYTGVWDPTTRSVHVRDPKAMKALWEQGFYGKGSLSRSEPNWLKREQIRRGVVAGNVSEERTTSRREERRQVKWERARTEQEAIERTRREEARLAASGSGTVDLLPEPAVSVLPADHELSSSHVLERDVLSKTETPSRPVVTEDNAVVQGSAADIRGEEAPGASERTGSPVRRELPVLTNGDPKEPYISGPTASSQIASKAPVGPLELLALPNSLAALHSQSDMQGGLNGVTFGTVTSAVDLAIPNGVTSEPSFKSPVGPLELLALPNSLFRLPSDSYRAPSLNGGAADTPTPRRQPNRIPEDDNDRSSGAADLGPSAADNAKDGAALPSSIALNGRANGSALRPSASESSVSEPPASQTYPGLNGSAERPLKRRKSVRFSPTVESTTFLRSDPPSPDRSVLVAKCNGATTVVENGTPSKAATSIPVEASAPKEIQETQPTASLLSSSPITTQQDVTEIEDKERLQLSSEEAFFLSFGLGALSVLDAETNTPISEQDLLALFRSHSYFPPASDLDLQPSDPFLVHYVVYHHFRSLGWVPRHGIKFGVDWLLYQRGPVFDHAEFGLIVLPAYSHLWWKEHGREPPRKSWHWLHAVNRVLSHVMKSLVLVYVDVPPPHVFDSAMERGGIAAALKRYKVREFMVRRWSSNRNR